MIETILSETEFLANSRHFEIINRIINEINNRNEDAYDGDIIADTKKALVEYVDAKLIVHKLKKRIYGYWWYDNCNYSEDISTYNAKLQLLHEKRKHYHNLRKIVKEKYGIIIK